MRPLPWFRIQLSFNLLRSGRTFIGIPLPVAKLRPQLTKMTACSVMAMLSTVVPGDNKVAPGKFLGEAIELRLRRHLVAAPLAFS